MSHCHTIVNDRAKGKVMAKFPNEDLFEGTKMTFGEHLEELRVVLVRGLVALVLGFLIGLYLADHVVEFIKRPIQDALVRHYGAMAVGSWKNFTVTTYRQTSSASRNPRALFIKRFTWSAKRWRDYCRLHRWQLRRTQEPVKTIPNHKLRRPLTWKACFKKSSPRRIAISLRRGCGSTHKRDSPHSARMRVS